VRRHQRLAIAALVLIAVALISVASLGFTSSSVLALTANNACKSNATGNYSDINISMTGSASPNPATVGGGVITLSGVNFQASVPATLLIAGYNLGLLTVGANSIPVRGWVGIAGANTTEGVAVRQFTATVSTTVGDPDGIPGTADETATPLSLNLSLADSTWTPTGGTVSFSQAPPGSLPAIPAGQVGPGAVTPAGGIYISAQVAGGLIKANFDCQAGTSAVGGATFTAATAGPFASVVVGAAATTTIVTTTVAGATTTVAGTTTTVAGATTTVAGSTTTAAGATTTVAGSTTTTAGSATTTTVAATTTTAAATTTTAPPAPVAGAGTYTSTCTNSVTPDKSELVWKAGGTVLSPLAADSNFKLTGQKWAVTIPASVFQTGINLSLITPGQTITGGLDLAISATNTTQGTQDSTGISLAIPVTVGATGAALPATIEFAVPDSSWTAKSGKIDFTFYGGNVSVSIGLPKPVVFVCKPTTTTPYLSAVVVGQSSATTTTAAPTTTVKAATATTTAATLVVTGPTENLVVQVLVALLFLDLGYLTLSLLRSPRRRLNP
jgi:hypothetical protein